MPELLLTEHIRRKAEVTCLVRSRCGSLKGNMGVLEGDTEDVSMGSPLSSRESVDCSALSSVRSDRRILIKLTETCRDVNAGTKLFFGITFLNLIVAVCSHCFIIFPRRVFFIFIFLRLNCSKFSFFFRGLFDFMLEISMELCPNKVF